MPTNIDHELQSRVTRSVSVSFGEDERPATTGDNLPWRPGDTGTRTRKGRIIQAMITYYWHEESAEWRLDKVSALFEQQKADGSWMEPKRKGFGFDPEFGVFINKYRPKTTIEIVEK